jgi:hypothetical protein
MQLRDMQPKHFHVIANLRHRADRRAGASDAVALFNGDGRRNALDAVHLRLVHPVQELAGVRGKRLDIAPLPLGEKGIKRQRTLARTA